MGYEGIYGFPLFVISQNFQINDEIVREFNDSFNTLLGRIDSNFLLESTILGQYLNSFEGNCPIPPQEPIPDKL
jgi:hypothetical protein